MASDLIEFEISTRVGEIVDITEECQQAAKKSTVKDGIVNIFMPGSTGGITTIEYEPGLVKTDIPKLLQHLIPEGPDYAHHRTWGDHNGAGHLRSFMIKPSLTVPVSRGRLILGTWQQVIYCEFDERPRHRTIYCQFVG
jgi:secondary thiamine-phosphate synthase enzyme